MQYCWNKALTCGVGLIQLSFHTIAFTQYIIHENVTINTHFSQIALRVRTLVLSTFRITLHTKTFILCKNYTLLVKKAESDTCIISTKTMHPCYIYNYISKSLKDNKKGHIYTVINIRDRNTIIYICKTMYVEKLYLQC